MCLASDPPTRPELSRGTCEVWDGDRWAVQTCVTVLTAACAFESMLDVQIFCTDELKSLQVLSGYCYFVACLSLHFYILPFAVVDSVFHFSGTIEWHIKTSHWITHHRNISRKSG